MNTPWNPTGSGDYTVVGVRAVLPEAVLPDASVVVRGGRIEAVRRGLVPGAVTGPVLDGNGALLMAGLVDVHTDGLEGAISPRAGARMPADFALADCESRLAAAGITTAFHAIGFRAHTAHGAPRETGLATRLSRLVLGGGSGRVDHRILHRLDVLCASGREELAAVLEVAASAGPSGPPALVSLEDHTPGQGQYREPGVLVDYIVTTDAVSRDAAVRRVGNLAALGREKRPVADETFDWGFGVARRGEGRLMLHDPDTVDVVDRFGDQGGIVAEFPTTLDAARRASQRGMLVVAGAPNLVRGGSHSGNVPAAELLEHGYIDALASDYLPGALLAAATVMVRSGYDWPDASALVSSGPARVAALGDRGSIRPGLRADLILVDDESGPWPLVRWSTRA